MICGLLAAVPVRCGAGVIFTFYAAAGFVASDGNNWEKSPRQGALFNINEPMVFGIPLVMNPYFFLPRLFDAGHCW